MITATGVCVELGRRRVLDGVDATVSAGRVLAVLGPNGAGKSTLLRACAGLMPSTGRITVDTVKLPLLSVAERARRIAFLPQRSLLDAPLTVAAVVAQGRYAWQGDFAAASAADRAAVARASERCGIGHLHDRRLGELSGGERARVLLARLLAGEAPTLLLDEPGAHLDLAQRLSLHRLLRELAAEGRAIAVTLHDLALVPGLADDVLVLDQGKVVGCGLDDQVLAQAFRVRRIAGEAFALTGGGP